MSSTATTALTGSRPVLSIDDLSLEFRTRSGTVRALDHVSLSVRRGEIVGIIGSRSSFDDFKQNGYGRYIAQIGGN